MILSPYIVTDRGVTVFYKSKPVSIDVGEPEYADVLRLLRTPTFNTDEDLGVYLQTKLDRLAAALEARNVKGINIRDGAVFFDGNQVHGLLAERMVKMLDDGFDLDPMKRFLSNLMQNPSYRAVNGLYDFLEAAAMPITPDGCFLAYKAVRADWRDIYSGRFDNSIGNVVEIPRQQVDEDPDRTCSSGLHVCSFGYLPNFAHANGHVVIVKINPADVVAVPRDYNNTKMRVSKYEVIEEVTDYYKNNDDYLRSIAIWIPDNSDEGDEFSDYGEPEEDEDEEEAETA